MKERFEYFLHNYPIKLLGQAIKRHDRELYNVIINHSQQYPDIKFSERMYIWYYDIFPECTLGHKRSFGSFETGFKTFCGLRKTCKCSRNHHAEILRKKHSSVTKEQRASIIEKSKKTCLSKYGVDNVAKDPLVKEKIRKTCQEKYGADSPLESSIIQDKIKSSIKERYSVDFVGKISTVQEKRKQTCIDKYGVDNTMLIARNAYTQQTGLKSYFSSKDHQELIREQFYKKYSYKYPQQKHLPKDILDILENRDLFIQECSNLSIAEAREKLQVCATTIARRAKVHNCSSIFVKQLKSVWEYKIKQLLIDLDLKENEDFIVADRTILSNRELDFYFPKINAALEVGSIFYHSEISAGREKLYHYDKWSRCREKSIDLYQYWDYELINSWDVISSKIKYLFKKHRNTLGARKITKIERIPKNIEQEFLNKNHIQGFSADRNYCFGAYYNNEVVGVLSLKVNSSNVKIIRYATLLSLSLPGLFSKILKHSMKELDINHAKILTYSNNRHSSGNIYQKSGFSLINSYPPTYYYTNDYYHLYNKKRFTKSKIKRKFNCTNDNLTEWQLMQSLDYDRIWDAGKKLWVLEFYLN